MIALLISDMDTFVETLEETVSAYGINLIRYRSAVKALDNLEEINPDIVFICTGDFPRHWKTLVQYIRSDTSRDETVIILLINDRFTEVDADKALYIGVQAMIRDDFSDPMDKKTLLEIFSRYQFVGSFTNERIITVIRKKTTFMFTNPINDTIITGRVEYITPEEIRFKPDTPSAASELVEGELIDSCTLKIDETVFSPSCRVKKNGPVMIVRIEAENEKLTNAIKLISHS